MSDRFFTLLPDAPTDNLARTAEPQPSPQVFANAMPPAPQGPQIGRRKSEDAVLDFDGWLSRLPQEQGGGFRSYLDAVPEAERPAAKRKVASIFAVSEATGLDPFTVRNNWEMVRGGYAEKQGPEWAEGKHDDEKFAGLLTKQAQMAVEQRAMIIGADSDDDAGKASRDTALASFMFRGAVLDEPAAESFVRWEAQAADKPSFKLDWLDAYYSKGKELHAEVKNRLAPVLPLVKEAYAALSTGKDLEAASETLFPRVQALSDAERRNFLAALRITAEAAPEQEQATFWSNFGESAARGTQGLGRGVADYGAGYWEAVKLQLSFYVPGMEPEKQLAGIEQKLGEHNLESDLRRVQEGIYSPVREVLGDYLPGWVERGLYAAPATVAYTAMALVPGAGLPGTFAAIASQSYEEARFRLLDAGLSDQEASVNAAVMAPIAAAPSAALERLGAMALVGQVPALKSALLKLGDAAGGGVAGYAVRGVGLSLAELTTERAQDMMLPIVEATAAALDKDLPAVTWRNGKDGVLDGFWARTGETYVALLPLALLGAVDGGSRRVDAISGASDLELKAFGARAQDIATFRESVQRGPASAADAAGILLARRDGASPEAKAASEELAQVMRDQAAAAAALNAQAMRDVGAARIVRDRDGWAIVGTDGGKTRVGSAQAALSIVQDMQQARSLREAEALVAIVDRWHDAAPDGIERETSLSGEIVATDGETVTATRGGQTRPLEMSAQALDELRAEARMDAASSGSEEIDRLINGSNEVEFRARVGEAAAKIVQRLELNVSESSPLTAVHEQLEAAWRTGLRAGLFSVAETQQAVAALSAALDPEQARDDSERAFRERVQKVARGEATATETRETIVELAVADVIGRRKDGQAMPAGSITTAVDEMLQRAASPADVRALGRFRAMLRAVRHWFRGVFGTVAAIKKAKRDGTIGEDWQGFMEKLLGMDGQSSQDAAAALEVEAIANAAGLDYVEPSEAEQAAGIAFSLSRPLSRRGNILADNLREGDVISREGKEKVIERTSRTFVYEFKGSSAVVGRVAEPGEKGVEYKRGVAAPIWLHFTDGTGMLSIGSEKFQVERRNTQLRGEESRDAESAAPQAAPGDVQSETPEGKISFGDGVTLEAQPAETFSTTAGNRLEIVARGVQDALGKAPEKRLALYKQANDNLQALAFRWQTERQTPRGDTIRPLVNQRDARTRYMEERWWEANRREELEAEVYGRHAEVFANAERAGIWSGPVMQALSKPGTFLHGRLKSKAAAMRSEFFDDTTGDYDGVDGVPSVVFGGDRMPDQIAEELFEAGLIKEPTADALWEGIKKEVAQAERWKGFVKTAKEELRAAKEQAHTEAETWRKEQEAMHGKDWSPRAQLIRDMQTLNAVLSVLPAEIRGQVGGFIKLAQVGPKARLDEIAERVQKAAGLLEKFLRAEYREQIAELFDAARPDMKAGKKPKGNMTAGAHRLAGLAEIAAEIPANDIEARINALAQDMLADDADLAGLAEQMQILQLFGGLKEADAVQLDAALSWLREVVQTGKNRWRMLEEARLADQKGKAAALKSDTGKAGDIADVQKGIALEKSLMREAGGWVNGLVSFEQLVGKLFGEGSEVGRLLINRYREATHTRTDATIAKRKAWETEMRRIFSGKNWREVINALYDHSQVTGGLSMEVGRMDGRQLRNEKVPVEIAKRAVEGTEETQRALGFDSFEVAKLEQLLAENDAAAPKNRKDNLDLERFTPGTPKATPLSQMQAVNLTMLARQRHYGETLAFHGWTPDVLADIESKLTAEAKEIREWLALQYRDGYASINEVFQRMFGAPLPQIENYSPGTFESQQPGNDMTPDGSGLMGLGGLSPGALKTRRVHRAAPRLADALATYWGHVAQMEHFKAFAEVSREARGVMLRPEVRASVTEKAGEDGLRALQSWVATLESDGVRSSVALTRYERTNQRLQNAVSLTALAWNIGTMAKNLMSAINSLYEMPAGAYLRGFSRLLSGKLEFRRILESEMIRRRIEAGTSPEHRQVIEGFRAVHPGKRTYWARRFVQAGMDAIGHTDAFGNTVSAAIYYDWAKGEALAAGMDEASADAAAMKRTEAMIDRTAQPVETMNRSLIENKMAAAPPSRWLFMFASEARQKAALYGVALSHALTGQAGRKDWQVLAVAHVVAPLMMQTIVNLLGDLRDDDDSEWFDDQRWNLADYGKAMLLGPLMGFPLLGKIANETLAWAFGRPTFKSDPTNPLDGMLPKIENGVEKVLDPKEAEAMEQGVKVASAAMSALAIASSLHPSGQSLQWLGSAGNLAKQVFQWGDDLLPATQAEARRVNRLDALRKRREARRARD